MALLSRSLIVDGVLWGTVYTFENVGDELSTHVHTEENNHITIVTGGSVRAIGHPKYEGKVLTAVPGGTIVNWKPGEPHGFVAMTDGATIVNIRKQR